MKCIHNFGLALQETKCLHKKADDSEMFLKIFYKEPIKHTSDLFTLEIYLRTFTVFTQMNLSGCNTNYTESN